MALLLRLLPLAVLTLTMAFLPLTVSQEPPPQVPCDDPRGCPDLYVDRLRMQPFIENRNFSPQSCAVQEDMVEPGARRLVRFTFTTPNLGPGDLIVGVPELHPEWFEPGTCHGHMHFREYADYRLWTPADFATWDAFRKANPELTAVEALAATGLVAVEGHKQGFCVIDIVRYAPIVPSKYLLCDIQGISVGWADEYHWGLDGQWIDVTGVAAGPYVLEAEVNAERLYIEKSYTNNRASVTMTI